MALGGGCSWEWRLGRRGLSEVDVPVLELGVGRRPAVGGGREERE